EGCDRRREERIGCLQRGRPGPGKQTDYSRMPRQATEALCCRQCGVVLEPAPCASVLSQNFAGIRTALHPARLRCSSSTCLLDTTSSSRLAGLGATTNFWD